MRTVLVSLVGALCVALAGCGGDSIDKAKNNANSTSEDMDTVDGATADAGVPDIGGDDAGGPTNNTNSMAGASVAPTSLQISEAGGTGTYTISLSSVPDADVIVDIANSDEAAVTVSPTQLTFSAGDFDPRTVTVTAVDNDRLGDATVVLTHTVTASGNYEGIGLAPVTVEVQDDDSVSGTVNPTALSLGEGTAGTFEVLLGVEPSGPVSITLTPDPTQVTLDAQTLTFEADNFNVAQTVSVLAVDDSIAEGPTTSVIVLTASGGGYDDLVLPTVSVAISDNDVPGIVLSKTLLTTSEDGSTDAVDVSLQSQPTAMVELLVANVVPTEGMASPLTLFFDATNWNVSQTLTITGVDDFLADGPQTYSLTLTGDSTDLDYDGLVEAVAVTNNDNDGASVNVSPLNLTVTEAGATSATFEVFLSSDPGSALDIDWTNTAPGEASFAPTALTFDSTNFGVPQTITVTAIDDARCDGNTIAMIQSAPIVSGSPAWNGLDPPDVTALVIDNDGCAVTISPTTGLEVSETGTTDTFTVVLNGEPTANVTVDFVSSDITQGTVSPASVTFAPIDWQVPRTVTVTGVDDACPDGDILFNIVTSITTTDPVYSAVNPTDVLVTNLDDETPAPIYSPMIGFPHTTTEAGGMATFTIALVPPGCPGPSSSVTIPLGVSDATEASVMPGNLVFTPANADVPQTVTVTGLDDADLDGDVPFLIVTDAIVSQDPYWHGFNPSNVPMLNQDDD